MLTRQQALKWFVTDEPWERHCKRVASNSELIAQNINGLDSEHAYVLGLIHDIGRKIDHGKAHPVIGYQFLEGEGYIDEALICITHTFPVLSDITIVPGMCHPEWKPNADVSRFNYDDIDRFIIEIIEKNYKERNYESTLYDKVVLISDLMSGGEKIVSLRERLEKTYQKYGDKPNKQIVYDEIFKIKNLIESLMKKSLEDLFKI